MVETSLEAIERYTITAERGFLPNEDPLVAFDTDRHRPAVGSYLAALDDIGERLPELLESGEARPAVEALPGPPANLLGALSERETARLCLLAGFFASGYVNQIGSEPVDRLPASVAVPLYRASDALGRKPMLSYDHICLHNFQRRNEDGGLTLDNLDTVQQFTPLADEHWFVVVHVAIESAAGPALVAAANAQAAARDDQPDRVRENLDQIAESVVTQTEYMSRMSEGNDPEVFATEFRPY